MPKKLSKRLQSIANLVPKNSYIADIGSDHAQLPIYLCETGTVSWAQAVENKTGPFLHMTHAIQESGLEGHIDCSRSDGISNLNEGVDTVLICGMGGMLACDILEAHTEKLFHVQTIIVDPHKDLVSVRKRVTALGYKIDEETMVYEDKIFYTIIRFVKTDVAVEYSRSDLLFGPILRKKRGETFEDWLKIQLKHVNDILNLNLPREKRDYYLDLYRLIRDEKNRASVA